MVGVISELILVFLLFCGALWLGRSYPSAVFPIYVGLLSLKFTPVGKRLKVSRLSLISIAFALGSALFVGRYMYGFLSVLNIENVDNKVFQFFFGSAVLRLFWSAFFGLFIALDLVALFLIPLAHFTAQGRYSDYEVYRYHRRQATETALYGMLGLSQGRINVRDGVAQMEKGPDDSLVLFGGPGELTVQEGNAVILELNGRVSRIVGSGLTFLKPFERVSMIVPLQTRCERVFVEQVVTSEGITIDQLEILVFHTIALGPIEECIQDGQFEYNETILRTKIWSPSANDWRETVRGITDRMTRKVVQKYTLHEVMRSSRDVLIEELKAAVSEVTVIIGIAIRGLDLGAVRVSPQVRAGLEEVPLAVMAVDAAKLNSEIILVRQESRVHTIHQMMRMIRSNLGDEVDPEYLIRVWEKLTPLVFEDGSPDNPSMPPSDHGTDIGPGTSAAPKTHDDQSDILVVRIENQEEGQPFHLDHEYILSVGVLSDRRVLREGHLQESVGTLKRLDVFLSAEEILIMPDPHRQLLSYPGRDAGFVEYRLVPQQTGPRVLRVDLYCEREWLQSLELTVEVIVSRAVGVTIRNSLTGVASDTSITSSQTAEQIVKELTSAMNVPLLTAAGGTPMMLRLLFRGMLVPHNSTMADIGVRDGSELWLVAAPDIEP